MAVGAKRWTVYGQWSLVWGLIGTGALVAITRSAVTGWSSWSDRYGELIIILAAPALAASLTAMTMLRRFPRTSLWICRLSVAAYVYLLAGLAPLLGGWTLVYLPALTAIYFACAALCREYGFRPAVMYLALPFEWWKREWTKAGDTKRQFREQENETSRRA